MITGKHMNSSRHWQEQQIPKGELSEMTELCYVIDKNNKPLEPTNYNNGWRLIRKEKAELVSMYPFIIKLKREVETSSSNFNICGIDTGSKFTGVAVVSDCKTKNKVLFKGVINHRQDVKNLMETRKGFRKYRRSHKRYRKTRFNNRASSKRKGRMSPTIKTNKDEIIRTINKLSKFLNIHKVIIEDVAIDTRKLQDGKLYKWQYQKSNRLDENLRKSVIIRDNNKCMECGRANCKLEVHHIVPRRTKGSDTVENLITLCSSCHDETKMKEEFFIEKYQKMINGKNVRFDYAQHSMQGKEYLREYLSNFYEIELTNGGDTANKRIDWNIEKSHSNDAICITGLFVNDINIKDWNIKPLRNKRKSIHTDVFGFKHRDVIKYTKKDNTSYVGYITSLDANKKTCNFTTFNNVQFKRYGLKSCKIMQRFIGVVFN